MTRFSHLRGRQNAPLKAPEGRTFVVTHPFHTLCGHRYAVLEFRRNWQDEKVWFEDESGSLISLPVEWTDMAREDLFRQIAAGRAVLRFEDLCLLRKLLDVAKEKSEKAPLLRKVKRTKGS